MSGMTSFFRSFGHAWRGLRVAFRTEQSFRIQVAIGLLVFAAVWLFPLGDIERVALLLAIGAVLVLELVNSMVERMVDLFKPRLHAYVRDIKDLMAAAVLLASVTATFVGVLVLWPHVLLALQRL
ncbi:diacylglycerol kinase family protein [Patescibacteria group bacterium]|nr:diacylglycerol kinase family protein [Patescibacteria group bacterium]MBU1448509.1 diacylglycerol kinase family protein [Patescibacteria group bacterium]MBU2612973.1 diacylglycerol kinase family protein [Patescibacteria group bacterium]